MWLMFTVTRSHWHLSIPNVRPGVWLWHWPCRAVLSWTHTLQPSARSVLNTEQEGLWWLTSHGTPRLHSFENLRHSLVTVLFWTYVHVSAQSLAPAVAKARLPPSQLLGAGGTLPAVTFRPLWFSTNIEPQENTFRIQRGPFSESETDMEVEHWATSSRKPCSLMTGKYEPLCDCVLCGHWTSRTPMTLEVDTQNLHGTGMLQEIAGRVKGKKTTLTFSCICVFYLTPDSEGWTG